MKYAIAAASLIALGVAAPALAQKPDHPRGPGGPGGAFGLFEFDSNADGRLTRAEFDAGQKARFDAMDANKDGVITADERRAHMETVRAQMAAKRPEGAERPERTGGPRGPRGEPADLTFAAFAERGARMFERADANKDGVVTIAEVQALKPGR